jgi:hypothetical protein
MSGFSDSQRHLNRFQIAHFADENNVRVLAQSAAQRVAKPCVSALTSR